MDYLKAPFASKTNSLFTRAGYFTVEFSAIQILALIPMLLIWWTTGYLIESVYFSIFSLAIYLPVHAILSSKEGHILFGKAKETMIVNSKGETPTAGLIAVRAIVFFLLTTALNFLSSFVAEIITLYSLTTTTILIATFSEILIPLVIMAAFYLLSKNQQMPHDMITDTRIIVFKKQNKETDNTHEET